MRGNKNRIAHCGHGQAGEPLCGNWNAEYVCTPAAFVTEPKQCTLCAEKFAERRARAERAQG